MPKGFCRAAAGCGLALSALGSTAVRAQEAQGGAVAQLQEIIVTAQRRGENLQSVPISVSTADARLLQDIGVRSTSDLATLAPSVTISPGVGGGTITIRGVGGTGSGSDEPSNAIYLDGVYQGSAANILFALNNVERIEVLKGPQGTLFGRNASGGLIQVITRQPQFSPEFKGEIGYGNYDTFRSSVYGNLPISDTIAVNVAAVLDKPGKGWGTNLVTGEDAYKSRNLGVRAKALWNLDDKTSITAAFLYARTTPANVSGAGILPGTTTATGGFRQPANFFDTNVSSLSNVKNRQYNYALTVRREFEPFTFTSITSRDDVVGDIISDLDRSPVPVLRADIRGLNDAWTQEFQLASPAKSKVQWTLGAYYYDASLDTNPIRVSILARGPGVFTQTRSIADTKSYAAYGQATAPITERTQITAGLRYTKDKRDIVFTTSGSPPTPTVQFPSQATDNGRVTWRLAVDHRLQDNVLLYASYSRGFKSGLFNATSAGLPAVEPQILDAYEIGTKTQWLDNRVRLNVAAYLNDVTNLQVKGIPTGFTAPIFYNGASAKIKGVDVEFQAAVTPKLRVQANLAYADGEYGSFTNALFITIPAPPATGIIGGVGDASGNRLALTPKWVGSVSAQYVAPTALGDVTLTGSYTYNGKMFYDAQNLVQRPVINIFNATASWRASDSITFAVWGNNLTDKHYYSQVESGPPNAFLYYPAAPRTYGFTLKYAYQ